MKYFYFFFFCCLPCVYAINSFEEFKTTFNKVYDNSTEESYRESIFYTNLNRIVYHNSLNKDFKLDMNYYGDLHLQEFYTSSVKTHNHRGFAHSNEHSELPHEVNWVNQNAVTAAKDQGQCGSCWAFSTTGALEGLYAIENHKLVNFSEQQLMDCSRKEGDESCNGGLMDYAFKYIIDAGGICLEEDYPYTEHDGTSCHTCSKVYRITSYKDVQKNNETALQYAVSKQPVSVAIQANSFELQFYSHGVFTGHCGQPGKFQLDHGVLAVGYGNENGKDYWYIKNSWGSKWGDNGFFKIERNVDYQEGKCGIAMQPSYPVNHKDMVLVL